MTRDERGAVMIIGLFMALAVVGALWCVIGIGNAILAHRKRPTRPPSPTRCFTRAA
jgi:hypothetical protein